MNLTQITASISKLLGQDVSALTDAELAQRLEDEATKTVDATEPKVTTVVETADAVVETPTVDNAASETPIESVDVSAINSRIDSLMQSIESLNSLVEIQTKTISVLETTVKTLTNLSSVLSNKVATMNVGATTTESNDQPIDKVTAALTNAQKDETVVNMNLSDFMGISQPSK